MDIWSVPGKARENEKKDPWLPLKRRCRLYKTLACQFELKRNAKKRFKKAFTVDVIFTLLLQNFHEQTTHRFFLL